MPLRHPGQYYDAEVGTFYNYFRDYNPATGRYVESDPIGLMGGMNTYGYTSSSPLMYFDPDGLTALAAPMMSPSLLPQLCENPFSCAAGVAAIGGYAVGTAIYPYVRPAVLAGIDYCLSEKDECQEEYAFDLEQCEVWHGRGPKEDRERWYRACKDRARERLRRCIGNGGQPDPGAPPPWGKDDIM